MKKINYLTGIFMLFTILLTGCSSTKKSTEEQKGENFEKEYALYQLAEAYGFKVGANISYSLAGDGKYLNLLKGDFNTITASNEFKAYSLLKQSASQEQNKPVMSYKAADTIARFAQNNNIGIRGHVLVWDAYMPDWFFRQSFTRDGDFVDSDTMKERLRYYITEVITHFETEFPGLVYCWDVVNEAVADGSGEWIQGNPYHLRKTRGGVSNIFNDVIGEDYVKFAFKCARDAVNQVNPDIKLFYNDYNTFYPEKRNAIVNLVKYLNQEERLCDGVGMQGYVGGYGSQNGCMNSGDLVLIKDAIKTYSSLGVEVQLTELAVRNYESDEATMQKHAQFYGKLFQVLIDSKKEGQNFTAVTIWGLCDNPFMDKSDYSYKMNGPFCGLFNKYYAIKDSYKEVYKTLEKNR